MLYHSLTNMRSHKCSPTSDVQPEQDETVKSARGPAGQVQILDPDDEYSPLYLSGWFIICQHFKIFILFLWFAFTMLVIRNSLSTFSLITYDFILNFHVFQDL